MSATSPIDKTSDFDDSSHQEDFEGGEKGNKGKPSGKGKDLSHVPCKFFKVGSCTAGSSCPFSHTAIETGQKDVCTWFVKGNCKFGHKCALAHILPGQSMSMDRKNKKAAQAASGGGAQGGRDGGRARPQKGRGGGNGNAQNRNPLLSGSTAPTRVLAGSARPSPFKTSLSPSAPAPPVTAIDFESFGHPDETNQLPTAPAHRKSVSTEPSQSAEIRDAENDKASAPKSPLSPHPPSAPRRVAKPTSPTGDFGPIGSPRSVSSNHGGPVNGFSPGTSPSRAAGGAPSSPFSAPGHRSMFLGGDDDFRSRAGLAASLGATKTLAGMSSPRQVGGTKGDSAVEEEDLEEFLPGSLTDLLTPEERQRRLSRTNPSRPGGIGWDANQRPNAEALHHRHSHSVPAPSLLSDIKSIWAEPGVVIAGSPDQRSGVGGLGNGTPSSFKSNSTFGGRAIEDTLSPSNASAAFLPGMHHYLGNRAGQRSTRPASSLHPSGKLGVPSSNPSSLSPYALGPNGSGLPPPHLTGFGNHPLDAIPPEPLTAHDFSGRPIPGLRDEDPRIALSPSARALQAHAPGQSLPQGLAAGYSRIHALPPTALSPSTPGAFSPPKHSGFSGSGIDFGESPGSQSGNLDAAMQRISYSTAAARSPSGQTANATRNPSGRGFGPFSPLSKPVGTGDDDDLFSMDG